MSYKEREKSGPGSPPEATLFEQAQAGNQESVNLLLMRHERLVHYVIGHQQLWGLPYEEAAQAGRQGLWRAILNYDPQRGTPFASYAYGAVMHHVWAAVQANLVAMRREVSIGELRLYVYREGNDPAMVSRREEVRQSLRALVGRLSARLGFVIIARYGLDGEQEQSLQAVGEQLGCTGEWLRQNRPTARNCVNCCLAIRKRSMNWRRHWQEPGCGAEQGIAVARGTPEQTRSGEAEWMAQMCFERLQAKLSLPWPRPSDMGECPKLRFRSHYRYLGWEELREDSRWTGLSLFALLLSLVDFSPLRAVLAGLMHWHNDRGWMPFDPVSIFLLKLWQLENRWNRSQVLVNVRRSEYAQIALRMGFEGCYPTEGGLRYIETCLGWQTDLPKIEVLGEDGQVVGVAVQPLNALIAQSVDLLRQAGLVCAELWQAALLCPDGMLHPAASHRDCASVQEAC